MSCGPEGRRTRVRQLQLGGEAADASPASVKPDEGHEHQKAGAVGTLPMPMMDNQGTIQRYSDLQKRLASATQSRRSELGLCFGGGIVSLLVVFGLAQLTTRTVQRSRRDMIVHDFTANDALHAELSARLQSAHHSP